MKIRFLLQKNGEISIGIPSFWWYVPGKMGLRLVEDILLTSSYGKYPIIYKVWYIPKVVLPIFSGRSSAKWWYANGIQSPDFWTIKSYVTCWFTVPFDLAYQIHIYIYNMYTVHNPVKNGNNLPTSTSNVCGEDTMTWSPLAVFEVLGAPALVRSAFTDPMEELRPGFEPEVPP